MRWCFRGHISRTSCGEESVNRNRLGVTAGISYTQRIRIDVAFKYALGGGDRAKAPGKLGGRSGRNAQGQSRFRVGLRCRIVVLTVVEFIA